MAANMPDAARGGDGADEAHLGQSNNNRSTTELDQNPCYDGKVSRGTGVNYAGPDGCDYGATADSVLF